MTTKPDTDPAARLREALAEYESAYQAWVNDKSSNWDIHERYVNARDTIQGDAVEALPTLLSRLDRAESEVARLLKMHASLLTIEERRILKAVDENSNPQMSYGMWCHMTSKGLIDSNEERDTHWLTEYGKQLHQQALAAADANGSESGAA